MISWSVSFNKRLLITGSFSHMVGQWWQTYPILASKLLGSCECDLFLCKFEVLISSIDQAFRNIMRNFSCNGNRVIMLIFS